MKNFPHYLNNQLLSKSIRSEIDPKLIEVQNFISSQSNKNKQEAFKYILMNGLNFDDFLRKEGFWCKKEEKDFLIKEFPFPISDRVDIEDIKYFIPKLESLERKVRSQGYMGYSTCRICGKLNGSKTFYDNKFAWPEGYKHCIEEHGVQPSAAFVLHVRGLVL